LDDFARRITDVMVTVCIVPTGLVAVTGLTVTVTPGGPPESKPCCIPIADVPETVL
jgi:hypothetical protein